MTKEQIVQEIIKALEKMNVKGAVPEASLMEELGLESLELFQLLAHLESIFSIRIPERVLMRVETIQDLAVEVSGLLK